jgi:GT2 family glycosyltransferase
MTPPALTVVIVHYNVPQFLEQCLCSVRLASEGLAVEVIVVDNASAVDPSLHLAGLYPEVRFVINGDNLGFAAANNRALRMSSGRYALLLNPDTVVGEGCFRELCAFMDSRPEAGAAGLKMLDARGRFLVESKRGFPTPWASFCKLFGLARIFPRSGYNLSYLSEDEVHAVDVLAGAFMLIRREALEHAGLLDEAFFMYGEDIDLSWRIRRAGYTNYYLPIRLLHYKGESSRQGDSLYIRSFYGAMLIFFRKYYPRSGRGLGLLIGMAVRLKSLQARLAGYLSGIKPRQPLKERRLLISGSRRNYETAKEICLRQLPGLASAEYAGEEHAPLAGTGITDIAFISPDIAFEEMLLQMERNCKEAGGSIRHHICRPDAGILVSPSK